MILDHSRDGIRFLQLHLGGDRNFCYLLGDTETGEAAAFDPGFEADRFGEIAAEEGLNITRILITHGHPDHTGQAGRLIELTGAELLAGAADGVPGARPVADGEVIDIGSLAVEALATPGHSPGHMCYRCEEFLVSGDLLFCGKIGGTGSYFPGSSAQAEYNSLQKLLRLPPETRVFPGHDYYGGDGTMTDSTVGFEAAHNPFLTVPDFAAFCHLKDNWARYKQEHDIR